LVGRERDLDLKALATGYFAVFPNLVNDERERDLEGLAVRDLAVFPNLVNVKRDLDFKRLAARDLAMLVALVYCERDLDLPFNVGPVPLEKTWLVRLVLGINNTHYKYKFGIIIIYNVTRNFLRLLVYKKLSKL